MAIIDSFSVNQDPRKLSSYYTALGVHPEYLTHFKRWEFLRNSYLGGYEYKMGEYLTKYQYESDSEYYRRIATTPYDNHVKAIVHIFNSFLYRQPIKRSFGSIGNMVELDNFLKDTDLEGRTFESFMRDVNTWSTVYGHCVVLMDKPQSVARTRAEELSQGIRPYASIYTPENVLDWEWKRQPSGVYDLTYLKLLEVEQRANGMNARYYIREFTKDTITISEYRLDKKDQNEILEQMPNQLGKIPAVWVYANRSPVRGIGVSDVGDIADMCNAIFNELSEIEQTIRLSTSPSLVKTPEVDAAAGPGAIITVPNETDPNLRPYLLQPSGQSVDSILKSIDEKITSIDRMACMSGIRTAQTRQQSGIQAMTEYSMLDAKLTEKAKNLELAEEQMFRLWANWQDTEFDGEIEYPMAFHIRDKNLDMDVLEKAARTTRDIVNAAPDVKIMIDAKIKEIIAKDPFELEQMNQNKVDEDEPNEPNDQMTLPNQMAHTPVTNPQDLVSHFREMIQQGYSNEEILELHPELANLFGGNNAGTES